MPNDRTGAHTGSVAAATFSSTIRRRSCAAVPHTPWPNSSHWYGFTSDSVTPLNDSRRRRGPASPSSTTKAK